MNHLAKLKQQLQRDCLIVDWNPTESQLQQIAAQLANSAITKKDDVITIIARVCPPVRFVAQEGIDNSDLRKLLELAIQVAKSKG